jgi:hypothetical protein
MKVRRSFFTLAVGSLIFLSLLGLGIPISGYGGNPHTCAVDASGNLTGHQGSLGGVATFKFTFAKDCPTDTSNAIQWNFNIYDYYHQATPICSLPPITPGIPQGYLNVDPTTTPPNTVQLTCSGLPNNPGRIKAAISYIVPGSTMAHSDISLYNP